jgi:hypothetical protein
MAAQTLDPRHDPNKDEMCFRYPFTGQANAEVRVCRSAIVQGEPWTAGLETSRSGSRELALLHPVLLPARPWQAAR